MENFKKGKKKITGRDLGGKSYGLAMTMSEGEDSEGETDPVSSQGC